MSIFYSDWSILAIIISAILGPLLICCAVLFGAKYLCCKWCGSDKEVFQMDWPLVHQKIPVTKSKEDKEEREALWNLFGGEGDGKITLEQCQTGVKKHLLLDEAVLEGYVQDIEKFVVPAAFKQTAMKHIESLYQYTYSELPKELQEQQAEVIDQDGSHVLVCVHNLTREDPCQECGRRNPCIHKRTREHRCQECEDNTTVPRVHFRVLLVYLRQYLELFSIFDELDQKSNDCINRHEFARVKQWVEVYGGTMRRPIIEFRNIPKEDGQLPRGDDERLKFDEFAQWALTKGLILDVNYLDVNLDGPTLKEAWLERRTTVFDEGDNVSVASA